MTDTAKDAICALTAGGPSDCGIRIATEASELDGSAAAVTLALAAEPEAGDEVVEDSGARLFLQPAASELLGDQTLDARVDSTAHEVNFFMR